MEKLFGIVLHGEYNVSAIILARNNYGDGVVSIDCYDYLLFDHILEGKITRVLCQQPRFVYE